MSNDKIVPFYKPRQGDPVFMVCPCQPDGVPYTIIALAHETHPIISKLLCPECETEISVVNGIPQLPPL